jgi:flagellar biosynthesis/type III secretory pathway protein FliH
MAIIIRKHGSTINSAGHAPRPIEFSFEDINDRANEYLETVRGEAAKIVQQAHQQAEQIRRQAQISGQQAAEAAAHKVLDETVAKRMETILPALDQLIAELTDAKAELLRRWEESAVAVAAAIAQRIIQRELAARPEITLDLVRETLQLAAGSADVTVQLNQADYENLGKEINQLAHSLCRITPTQIEGRPQVSPGGCIVKTKYGEIDGRIEAQLVRIQAELK